MVPSDGRSASVQGVRDALRDVQYLADDGIAGVAYLADKLSVDLVEGPAGTGKTQLAKSIADITGSRLIRLQCYEGLDESKALRVELQEAAVAHPDRARQRGRGLDGDQGRHLPTSSSTRPLLEAITATDPVVLLIDGSTVEVETTRAAAGSSPTTRCRSPSSARSPPRRSCSCSRRQHRERPRR
jgi:MoxR-like ATPase